MAKSQKQSVDDFKQNKSGECESPLDILELLTEQNSASNNGKFIIQNQKNQTKTAQQNPFQKQPQIVDLNKYLQQMENLPQVSRNLQDYKNIQESMLPTVAQKKWKGTPIQKTILSETGVVMKSHRKLGTNRMPSTISLAQVANQYNQMNQSMPSPKNNSSKFMFNSNESSVSKSSLAKQLDNSSQVEQLQGKLQEQLQSNEVYIFLENMKVQVSENKLQIQNTIQKCDMMIFSIEKIHFDLGNMLIATGKQLKDSQYLKRMGYL